MAILVGNDKDNFLSGTDQADTISGKSGNDWLYGNGGSDKLYGGDGDDEFRGGGGRRDYMFGGKGNDRFELNAAPPSGSIKAYGGLGDDVFQVAFSGFGDLLIDGGRGHDILLTGVSGHIENVHIDTRGTFQLTDGVSGKVGIFSGFEEIVFSCGDEDDWIHTGHGNDYLEMDGGRNTVNAGAGDDQVSYHIDAANHLMGGAGNDVLTAAGTDQIHFTVDTKTGIATDGNGSVISGFEAFVLNGNATDSYFQMGSGNDTFYGGTGHDTIYGCGGNDMILRAFRGHGGLGEDVISSNRHDAILFGGAGNDTLSVSWIGGTDMTSTFVPRLYGGTGDDTFNLEFADLKVTGGAGADVFRYDYDVNYSYIVTDFTTGEDQIQVWSGVSTDQTGPITSDQFAIGQAIGTQGQFVLSYNAATNTSHLGWDWDGDKSTSIQNLIDFIGKVTMTASDILIF